MGDWLEVSKMLDRWLIIFGIITLVFAIIIMCGGR